MMLPRIFFDANDGTMESGYWLDFEQSLEDIANIGKVLHEGMHVIIYQPQELEMEAIIRFDEENNCWIGIPIRGTIRHLDIE